MQKNEQQQKQLRESWQAEGINSIRLMHQQRQQEEIKLKLKYVLSSPLVSSPLFSSPTYMSSPPTPCSSVWVVLLNVC